MANGPPAARRAPVALILDFDGTLTRVDVLQYVTEALGHGGEGHRLQERFRRGAADGTQTLVDRVALLAGVDLETIRSLVQREDLLRPGARELGTFFDASGLHVVLASGNICPIVECFGEALRARRIFCSRPTLAKRRITGLDARHVGKRLASVGAHLEEAGILPTATIAVGDDRSDIPFFEYSAHSIAFHAPSSVAEHAVEHLTGDLSDLAKALERWLRSRDRA